jgi:hypothetical protein
MAYGVWRMVYGVWRMAYGVWQDIGGAPHGLDILRAERGRRQVGTVDSTVQYSTVQ